MHTRRIFDDDLHAHFVTFSCYKRRRLLDHDQSKRIVLGALNAQLDRLSAQCIGFVVMPDHVHALVWFSTAGQLSELLKQWKRMSSYHIGLLLRDELTTYAESISPDDPVWQAGFHDFNVYSEHKVDEKLEYMHLNPVRAGLVERAIDWPWSSARYYDNRRSVGVPIRYIS